MRPLVALVLASLLVCGSARGDQTDPRLDRLFEALRAAGDPIDAAPIEAEIWSVWTETADAEAARLMDAGVRAMERRALLDAVDAFTAAIRHQPRFAEAWNKRATAYFYAGDYAASVRDIESTLALEPRHFGALSGLGLVYARTGNAQAAVRSFRAALAIHPNLAGARANVKRLEGELDGEPT